MKEFNGVQKDILLADKKNQLVSAGAGSGKTTVMIEKISNLLLNGSVDIDNLLVVTFTVLAAQEMKERLINNLKNELLIVEEEKKENILNIIEKISTASIDTIDGFSSKTIKKYFYELGISPNIKIVSETTKDYYLSKAMQKTFADIEKSGDKINLMLDLFGGNSRNLKNLQEVILSCYYNVINIDDYEKFLNDCVEEYNDSIKSEMVVNCYLCALTEKCIGDIIAKHSMFSNEVKDKLNVFVELLQKFNKHFSFMTNLKTLTELEPLKFLQKEIKENEGLKELILKINDIFEFKNNLEKNQINENYQEKNAKIYEYFNIFLELLNNFINNYNKIKEKNNLIDFNDLNRLMLKLLKNDNVRIELQRRYKYIFIDEYQDVNPLQDSLMNLLTGEETTVFMVGDVKQSIYGFRGSSPEWFLNKYDSMKKSKINEDVFDMNINFRSSPKILNFINEVFSVLMTKEVADIDYKNDCLIEPKRLDIVDDKVKILLVEEEKSEDIENGLYSVKNDRQLENVNSKYKEAMLVLKTITELVGTEFYDANLKQNRVLDYGDIAILTHSDKDENSKILIDLLKRNNVPLNLNNKLEISCSEAIKLVVSILKCVCYVADDVDYLATMLALTDLDIDDIVEIRDKNFSFYENLIINQQNLIENSTFLKIKHGFSVLEDIRKASYSKTNKDLIYYILDNKKLRYFLLRKPNGEKELSLLEEFLEKLSSLEESLDICEFIEMVESSVSSSGDFETKDKESSVCLQTIHKSKGLEYPVVILFNSSKVFSYLRENDSINFNADIGFGIDYFDVCNRIKTDSLTKFAIRIANSQKGYKEELRLLYVAMTRAKNKLFITGTIKNKDFEDIKKTSYVNMLLSCFEKQLGDDGLEKENFVIKFIDNVEFLEGKSNFDNREVEIFKEDFIYPNEKKFLIPFKNTVTGINKDISKENNFEIKKVFRSSVQYDAEDRALLGVNYHTALENLDLTKPYEKNTDIQGVDYAKIRLAHEKLSPLVENCVDIKKEAEFMMYVPYCDVVASDIEDKVLIQGVVDLIIEKEKSIILVDYKFSKLPAFVLKEKYKEQLKLYKKAIELSYNKPVEQMFIYSIESGELV